MSNLGQNANSKLKTKGIGAKPNRTIILTKIFHRIRPCWPSTITVYVPKDNICIAKKQKEVKEFAQHKMVMKQRN